MAKKKRRLSDLYVRGAHVAIGEETGDPVQVYLRKLPPTLHEKAVKRANAARSVVLAGHKNKDGEDYLEALNHVLDMERDELVEYLVEDRLAAKVPVLEAELAAEDEWAEDGYLDGLHLSWIDGLDEEYAKDPEHPEAKRVFEEMKRFDDAMQKLVDGERKVITRDIESKTDEQLQQLVVTKFVESRASIAWLTEFRLCQVWLGTFEDDEKTPYFETREEVGMLELEVLRELQEKYQDLTIDPVEGKG